MAGKRKSKALIVSDQSDLVNDSSDERRVVSLAELSLNELKDLDVDRLKALFELQEEQREREFQRELKLRDGQSEILLRNAERERASAEKERKLEHQFALQKLNLYFKMFVSVVALTLGTIFVLTGHDQVGNFLLGGALTTITSSAVTLMRASRRHE